MTTLDRIATAVGTAIGSVLFGAVVLVLSPMIALVYCLGLAAEYADRKDRERMRRNSERA